MHLLHAEIASQVIVGRTFSNPFCAASNEQTSDTCKRTMHRAFEGIDIIRQPIILRTRYLLSDRGAATVASETAVLSLK